MDWQPIDSAPKDDEVLGYSELGGVTVIQWDGGEWRCPDWDGDKYVDCSWEPTHWMPLPAPPAS